MNIITRPDAYGRAHSDKHEERKKVLLIVSVASMLDLFNRENIRILLEYGCQVEVAANFSFGNITNTQRVETFRKELLHAGISVYDIPIPRRAADLSNIVRSYRMLKKLCENNSYQLIHTQSPIGGALSRLAAKNTRKKGTAVIYTAHGFHFYKGAPLINWLLFYPVEWYLSAYTDGLITINAEDYRRAELFCAGRVYRVPGIGVQFSDFYPDVNSRKKLRRKFGFGEHDFVVMSVGQLSERKNQEVIIRAIAKLNRKNIRYVIVGLGEKERMYRKLSVRLGIERNVCLTGYLDDVAKLLQMADCFAFPSLQEGLPVALMEAMAAGVPIVCSRIRGNRDLIRNKKEGRTVQADDVQGFAEAIGWMMDHPNLAEAYKRAAKIRVEAYATEQVNKKMRRIYTQYLQTEADERINRKQLWRNTSGKSTDNSGAIL